MFIEEVEPEEAVIMAGFTFSVSGRSTADFAVSPARAMEPQSAARSQFPSTGESAAKSPLAQQLPVTTR